MFSQIAQGKENANTLVYSPQNILKRLVLALSC